MKSAPEKSAREIKNAEAGAKAGANVGAGNARLHVAVALVHALQADRADVSGLKSGRFGRPREALARERPPSAIDQSAASILCPHLPMYVFSESSFVRIYAVERTVCSMGREYPKVLIGLCE